MSVLRNYFMINLYESYVAGLASNSGRLDLQSDALPTALANSALSNEKMGGIIYIDRHPIFPYI